MFPSSGCVVLPFSLTSRKFVISFLFVSPTDSLFSNVLFSFQEFVYLLDIGLLSILHFIVWGTRDDFNPFVFVQFCFVYRKCSLF